MLEYINGVECWHSLQDETTSALYLKYAIQNHLLFTGGSDCHQRPVIMGTVSVPQIVAEQLNTYFKE